MNNILENFGIILLIIVCALLGYAYRSNFNEFQMKCWFLTNRIRFVIAVLLSAGVAVLLEVQPEAVSVLGIDAGKTPIGIALAIAGVLIAGIPGNSAK